MSKRRVHDSDDEVDEATTTPIPKRARTANKAGSSHNRREEKRNEKRNDDDDTDGSDDSDNEGRSGQEIKEVDERQFEEGYEDLIRASLEAKRKVQGGVAEHGIIEHIEMHQFMCHKYLAFNFGPQINFIIGHNGSGKSAVLSAITVALGGKTTSTGRGSGLKSFIREGQSVAEVTITLKNQGEEAYKPQLYGKSIIITRRFTKEGSSTWKIQNKDKHVVSNKKEELASICDHMNIQVDNPMNVLTQDSARQFLSASHPTDKYKFFLKGTQLSQLSDEYELCFDNIKIANNILNQKKDALPDLRTEFHEATLRFQEAHKAREQKKKADDIKKELAWAHVKTKEHELEKKMKESAQESARLSKFQAHVDEAEAKFQSASEEVARYEAEFQDLGDVADLHAQRTKLREQMRANAAKLADFRNDEKQMDASLKGINRQIEEYTAQIAEETRKLEADTQAKRDEAQQRLQTARDAVTTAEEHLASVRQQRLKIQNQSEELKSEGVKVQKSIQDVKSNIQAQEIMVRQFGDQKRDQLAAFGKNMDALVAQINRMQWRGDVPLGPLGVGVKVRDEYKWASDVLRAQLGNLLTAFAITDARDMPALKKLLVQSGNPGTTVIIFEKDLFDYSGGEPPKGMLTALRALEISDPYVLRILINQASIERIFLAHNFDEADHMVKSSNGGIAWTKGSQRVMAFSGGGGQTSQLLKLNPGHRHLALLTGRDAAADTRHFQEELKQLEDEYKRLSEQETKMRNEYTKARRELDVLGNQERKADADARNAKMTVENLLQAANDDLPASVAGLEAAKAEAEAEKDSVKSQYAQLATQKTKIDDVQKPLLTKSNELKAQIEEFDQRARDIQTQIENAVTARMQAQRAKGHYQEKLEAHQKKIEGLEAQVQVLQEEFINWTAKAEEYCPRVENPRTPHELDALLAGVTKALMAREKRQGASVEELTIQVNKAKARLDLVEHDLRSMAILNKTLRHSLNERLSKWQEFRRHIALRCKLVFQFNLSHRGYFGKVLFDHANGTLQLKVQTDDMAGTQGAQDKDPRSLSGGEKSFSTICLLLSLWESIGCPLRCLDEFDVFMDAVNRRISMKMMIETANSSDKKQYILITPQDMTNVQLGPTVKVNRMPDPERGQGQLAFAG